MESTSWEEVTQNPRTPAEWDDNLLKSGFMSKSSPAAHGMGALITPNSVHLALGGFIRTPGEFYVNLVQSWNRLEAAQAVLQVEYRRMDIAPGRRAVPWPGHLTPGYILAAKCCREREYHRAKIVQALPDGRYKVILLDYGDTRTVSYSDLRYLRVNHYETLRPQGIRCRVSLASVQNWSKDDGALFLRLLYNQTFAVRFKNRAILEDGSLVWDVDVHIYSERLQRITSFHVERQLVLRSGRSLTLTPEEVEATEVHPFPRLSLIAPQNFKIVNV